MVHNMVFISALGELVALGEVQSFSDLPKVTSI